MHLLPYSLRWTNKKATRKGGFFAWLYLLLYSQGNSQEKMPPPEDESSSSPLDSLASSCGPCG